MTLIVNDPRLSRQIGSQHLEAVHRDLRKPDSIFDSTPAWHSGISDFLRLREVQYVISTCLCDSIWLPFSPHGGLQKHEVVGPFWEALSKSLSASGVDKARALTLRSIYDHDTESSRTQSTILQPLTT